MIANHGQEKKYYHKVLGCNSRLDSIQAAILNVKLKELDAYAANRNKMADVYYQELTGMDEIRLPKKANNSDHVFHQFTLIIKNGKRDDLKLFLSEKGIPSMIYYPLPLYKQEAFKKYVDKGFKLPVTEQLCNEVLSLPIHTEMDPVQMDYICKTIKTFFTK